MRTNPMSLDPFSLMMEPDSLPVPRPRNPISTTELLSLTAGPERESSRPMLGSGS